MANQMTTRKALTIVGLIALGLDVVWALLVATFYASIVSGVGTAVQAGHGAVVVGSITGWILTFIIAMFQGAVFFCILAVFVFVGAVLYSTLFKKKS